jgi:hypothetical protein
MCYPHPPILIGGFIAARARQCAGAPQLRAVVVRPSRRSGTELILEHTLW